MSELQKLTGERHELMLEAESLLFFMRGDAFDKFVSDKEKAALWKRHEAMSAPINALTAQIEKLEGESS
jgi:cell division protein FtsB